MNNPSLLDYLAARLRFWRAPPEGLPSLRQLWFDEGADQTAPPADDGTRSKTVWPSPTRLGRGPGPVPWALGGAVLLAVAGQGLLDPEAPRMAAGIVLLVAAVVAVAVAERRGEARTPSGVVVGLEVPESAGVRWKWAAAAVVVALAAGAGALGNRMGPFTIVTWLAAIGLALAAVTPAPAEGVSRWRRLTSWIGRARWRLGLDRSTVLPLVCVALALVVRTGELARVPLEMVSLHAELLLSMVRAVEAEPPIVFPFGVGGLEPVPVFLGALLAPLAGGLSFASLKLGTLVAGLATLPFVYLLGRELAGRTAGLGAMALAAVGQWPDLLSRLGLADGWYPPFAAAALLLVVRGIRHSRRRDFVAAGIVIGLAIQTVSMARSLLLATVVLVAVAWFPAGPTRRRRLMAGLAMVVVFALLAGLPTTAASFNAGSGAGVGWWLGAAEGTHDGSATAGIGERLARCVAMPLWSDGPVWVHGALGRPALDRTAAALLVIGAALTGIGAVRRRRLEDLLLLISVPVLMLPAVLAALQPELAPSPMRCSGAMAPIFVLAGIGLASVVTAVSATVAAPAGRRLAAGLAIVVVALSMLGGRTVVHRSFAEVWDRNSWNASELGEVVRGAAAIGVPVDCARVVGYPHWVDARLVAAEAGFVGSDLALDPTQVDMAAERDGPQLFLVHPEDHDTVRTLADRLPAVTPIRHASRVEGKEFLVILSLSMTGGS